MNNATLKAIRELASETDTDHRFMIAQRAVDSRGRKVIFCKMHSLSADRAAEYVARYYPRAEVMTFEQYDSIRKQE